MKRLLNELDCCCCLIAFFSLVQGLPVQDSSGIEFSQAANGTDVGNVCLHGDKTYTPGQNFSTSNPCETCTCDPPGVSCSLSSCDLKPGCKAIHKANQCCPEYVCECERNGKMYGNGEKVEEPNPCKVCYCKGGEIKCALVTCYTRDDCEPGYVAGVCCPKYDHCPPLEMMKNKSTTPVSAQVIISDLKTDSPPIKHNHIRKTFTPESTTTETTEPLSSSTDSTVDITSTTLETSTYETTEELNNTTDGEYELYTTLDHTIPITEDYTTDITTEEMSSEGTTVTTTSEIIPDISTTEESSSTTTDVTTELDSSRETVSTTVSDYSSSPQYESTTETDVTNATTEADTTSFKLELIDDVESESTVRKEVTVEPTTEKPYKSVIKVIVPKTMKKDLDLVQKNVDGPAPIVVMISADQIQFLKLAEEPPVYVDNRDAENQKVTHDHIGVVVVPKTTPTTVEMVKVVDGTSVSNVHVTTESNFPANGVNTTVSPNSTDIIQER